MDKLFFKYMSRDELHLRKSAVEYAFRDNRIDTAVKIVIRMSQKHPWLYKFYRPRPHSVQALMNSEIFMCRPSSVEQTLRYKMKTTEEID